MSHQEAAKIKVAAAAAGEGVEAPSPTCRACAACKKPATGRCSRCKSAWYCGRACQAVDWRAGHWRDCPERLAWSELVRAVESGDAEAAKRAFGPETAARDRWRARDPLALACYHDKADIAAWLIGAGCAVDECRASLGSDEPDTPLAIACARLSIGCIELLLEKGANANGGQTMTIAAASAGAVSSSSSAGAGTGVERHVYPPLIRAAVADPYEVFSREGHAPRQPPLRGDGGGENEARDASASAMPWTREETTARRMRAVDLLLDRGADPSVRTPVDSPSKQSTGVPVLEVVAAFEQWNELDPFEPDGRSLRAVRAPPPPQAPGSSGSGAVASAAASPAGSAFSRLIAAGADLCANSPMESRDGDMAPLVVHRAAAGDPERFELLLVAGARAGDASERTRTTALMAACDVFEDIRIAQIMAEYGGCGGDGTGDAGRPEKGEPAASPEATVRAARYIENAFMRREAVVAMLLLDRVWPSPGRRADYIAARDSRGATALHYACHFGVFGIVRALVAAGADALAGDIDGVTPYDYAAQYDCDNKTTSSLRAVARADAERRRADGGAAAAAADDDGALVPERVAAAVKNRSLVSAVADIAALEDAERERERAATDVFAAAAAVRAARGRRSILTDEEYDRAFVDSARKTSKAMFGAPGGDASLQDSPHSGPADA